MSASLRIAGLKLDFYGVHVLRGVDLEVPAGSFTGLIGPNGAGKSTLFNAISGLYRPKGGTVHLGASDTTGLPPEKLVAAGLVRTFPAGARLSQAQRFPASDALWRGAAGREPAGRLLRLRARAKRREAELAERAHGIARRLRLDHVLDNPVTALSGGQKKLVEIGRALMAEPKVLLLDEPMAGVNPTLADQIAEHLTSLNRDGLTICLIEHDMALIKRLCASRHRAWPKARP